MDPTETVFTNAVRIRLEPKVVTGAGGEDPFSGQESWALPPPVFLASLRRVPYGWGLGPFGPVRKASATQWRYVDVDEV